MYKVVITGGIASGKSTVTNYLISKGYTVVDSDKVSREFTASGGKSMPLIEKEFGKEYILSDGSLDRNKMRTLVYDNPEAKIRLEMCTTKLVIEETTNMLNNACLKGEKIAFLDSPVFFEANVDTEYDSVWLVTADDDLRVKRAVNRDGLDPEVIQKIIDSQMPESEKIKRADEVIYNNSTEADLFNKIDILLNNCCK